VRLRFVRKPLLIAPALASMLLAVPALAGSQGPSVQIGASVVGNCNNVTTGALTLGNYDPFTYPSGTPQHDSTPATLSVNCTNGDTIAWSVGNGGHCGSGSIAGDRAMTDGSSHYLSYELFTSSLFSTQYGTNSCGTATSIQQTAGGTALANTLSIFGSIPGGQNATVGQYTDTVQVTVSY
jgi:spore coat protein U-like protein